VSSEEVPLRVRVETVSSKRDLDRFIRFPVELYSKSPNYVPHLILERKEFFDSKKNPFFEHGDVSFFLALDERGRVVGRCTAHVDWNYVDFHGENCGFFGFFDSVDSEDVASALLSACESFAREKGMERIMGPMNFNTNGEVGVLVEGFEGIPFFMMPYNYPYYGRLIESCGYRKEKDLYAYFASYPGYTPDVLRRVSSRVRKNLDIEIRTLNLKDFERELDLVKEIYNSAWEKNWGFVPMTDGEIEYMAKNLKPLVDPDIVLFAYVRGQPVGFFLALPDYNLILKELGGRLFPFGIFKFLFGKKKIRRVRVMILGVIERFRKMGIEAVLLDEIYERAPRKGYTSGELSWILEDNVMMNRIIRRLTDSPYRTYRVYGREI